jgi:hypothetical protein
VASIRSRIAKGRSFQKKVMLLFKEVFQLSDDDIRSPVGSETGEDVKFSEKAREIVRLSIECKNVKAMTDMFGALEQCLYNTMMVNKKRKDKVDPMLVVHKSVGGNRKIWATVELRHYLDLRKKILELENKICSQKNK